MSNGAAMTCPRCGRPLTNGKCHRHYIIPLRARVKPRPRVSRNHTYMPDGYTTWRELVRGYIYSDGQPAPDTSGDKHLTLTFRFKGKGRGDADNLAGGIMDACNGLLYDDDSQVVELHTRIERNTGRDEIEVSIWEL